jgi:hypothetical protein
VKKPLLLGQILLPPTGTETQPRSTCSSFAPIIVI